MPSNVPGMKKIFPSWGAQPTSSAPMRSQPSGSGSTRGTAIPGSSASKRRSNGPPGTYIGTGGKVGSGGKGLGKGKGGLKRHRYERNMN